MAVNRESQQRQQRLAALVLLLEHAFETGPLTREEIVRDLKIDQYPVTADGPRLIPAYEGDEQTTRAKFERDKVSIRELGIEIQTVKNSRDEDSYQIDRRSIFAPAIDFTPDEERVVATALALSGVGRGGAFSLFLDGPTTGSAPFPTTYLNPLLRAIRTRRVLKMEYESKKKRERLIEPYLVHVFDGVAYVIAVEHATDTVKGYRLNRITKIPELTTETFERRDELEEAVKTWRPNYESAPEPVALTVRTNDVMAELLQRNFPNADRRESRQGHAEVTIPFASEREALRFVLESGTRLEVVGPEALRRALRRHLKGVNQGDAPSLNERSFREGPNGPSPLALAIQMQQAVNLSPDGLSVSELAHRFGLEEEQVRYLMDRLVSLEPLQRHGSIAFPGHLLKDFRSDDPADDFTDDSIYRAAYDSAEETIGTSHLMWRDLYELNVALSTVAQTVDSPALRSAIDKIERVIEQGVRVDSGQVEPFLRQVMDAVAAHRSLKIRYLAPTSPEPNERVIDPRDVRTLNGHSLARAFCHTRGEWRNFRVDRIYEILAESPAGETPADTEEDWVTHVAADGEAVVVAMVPEVRGIFESIPNAVWQSLPDGRHAVRFRVADPAFLDSLMVLAGPGAVVVTPYFKKAGRALAKEMLATL